MENDDVHETSTLECALKNMTHNSHGFQAKKNQMDKFMYALFFEYIYIYLSYVFHDKTLTNK